MEAALKSYSQTKDFNSSARHDLESSLGTIEVSRNIPLPWLRKGNR
jgi:hypothetical protein